MDSLKLYFLLICVSAIYGASVTKDDPRWSKLPEECGKTRYNKKSSRIIGGSAAKLGQFPWIARLGIHSHPMRPISFFCGGTIISRYYVISAAHCEEKTTLVRVGENIVSSVIDCDNSRLCSPPHQDILVKRHIFADFCATTFYNDLSIIELERPIQFNEFVQPACLPRHTVTLDQLLNQPVQISGWGTMSSIREMLPDNLMYINNAVIERDECNVVSRTEVLESQICAGVRGLVRGNGSCFGDSGGPLTKYLPLNGEDRGHLIGVVSNGYAICEFGPTLYTNVSHYMNWILDNIKYK